MWVDRVLALLAIVALIGFLSVLLIYLKRVDVTVTIVAVALMAAYDFYRELRSS